MALTDPVATPRSGRRTRRYRGRERASSTRGHLVDGGPPSSKATTGQVPELLTTSTTIEFNVRQIRDEMPRPSTSSTAARSSVTGPTWARRYARGLVVTDLLCLLWAGVGVQLFEPPHPPFVAATVLLLGTGWLLALDLCGTRDSSVVGYGAAEYKRIIHASLIVFGLVAIGAYLFHLDLPRSTVAIMLPAGLFGLLGTRYIWRRWLARKRRGGAMMSKVVAVGDRQTVGELLIDLARAPYAGYQVVGVCVNGEGHSSEDDQIGGVPVLGRPAEVAGVAVGIGADAVAVTASAASARARFAGSAGTSKARAPSSSWRPP